MRQLWCRPVWASRRQAGGVAEEEHVPAGSGPGAPVGVAGDPLLLGAGVDVSIDEVVGHPSAAGPAAVLVQHHVAEDVHAAEGDGLGDGPLHGAAGGREAEVFGGAPEDTGGVVLGQAGVGVDVPGDVGVVGRDAEAEDFGVVADGDVDLIGTGSEEEGVAIGAELRVLLAGVDGVNLSLNLGAGHRR